MKKVNIQFFSTLDENIEFITKLFKQDFAIILQMSSVKKNVKLDNKNINSLKEILNKYNSPFWSTNVYFLDKNFIVSNDLEMSNQSDTLSLRIGEHTENFLRESRLSTSLKFIDEELNNMFFKIGQQIKKETKCGGLLLIDDTKTEKIDKKVRFTSGALKFNESGGKVFQYNPNIHFKLSINL